MDHLFRKLFVGRLRQNWLGLWRLDEKSALGSAFFHPNQNKGIVWSASGITYPDQRQIAFYSGMISNLQIKRIVIKTEDKTYEDVPLIQSKGSERFFFIKANGDAVPASLKAFSAEGELILED
ncbi:MAG TPA: hypothetical protein VF199_07750 [Bacillales bacterium]